MPAVLDASLNELLRTGLVIPAHPLALNAKRQLDERHQQALTRYYRAAGAGGVAVGVHTTQFAIRDVGLFEPVLSLVAETAREVGEPPMLLIAGVVGDLRQAVGEAEVAASLGYHAVLLSPFGADDLAYREALERARAVGEVLPVIGFYMQEAVGGRYLPTSYWRELAKIEAVVAMKIAPFDRYRTLDLVRGVAESGRADQIALYTGNDDNIIGDLLTPFRIDSAGGRIEQRIVGGLLGQWATGTHAASRVLAMAHAAQANDADAHMELAGMASQLTDLNAAVFDASNRFRGCIAGVHEMLRRQGLLAGTWCIDPNEGLSPGQAAEIARLAAAYPTLTDDYFVAEHLDEWLG